MREIGNQYSQDSNLWPFMSWVYVLPPRHRYEHHKVVHNRFTNEKNICIRMYGCKVELEWKSRIKWRTAYCPQKMLTYTQHLIPPRDVQLITLSQYSYSQLCGYCAKITFGDTKSILDQHSKNECIFIRAHLLHRPHKHWITWLMGQG